MCGINSVSYIAFSSDSVCYLILISTWKMGRMEIASSLKLVMDLDLEVFLSH
jgi:hypothetical protein